MSWAGDDGSRIRAGQRGSWIARLLKNDIPGNKLQHWRGSRTILALQAAPVLEFH